MRPHEPPASIPTIPIHPLPERERGRVQRPPQGGGDPVESIKGVLDKYVCGLGYNGIHCRHVFVHQVDGLHEPGADEAPLQFQALRAPGRRELGVLVYLYLCILEAVGVGGFEGLRGARLRTDRWY